MDVESYLDERRLRRQMSKMSLESLCLALCAEVQPYHNLLDFAPRHLSEYNVFQDAREILECRNVLARVVVNGMRMQTAQYTTGSFSILVAEQG